jgi:hypothetical protein
LKLVYFGGLVEEAEVLIKMLISQLFS